MLESLRQLDRELFIYLNSHHSSFWDPIMVLISNRYFWIPAYLLLAVYLVYFYRRKGALMVAVLLLAAGASDRISSGIFKGYFARLRPCHDPQLSEIINIVDGCGGQYGFMSSHAANTFAMAIFLTLILPQKYRGFKIALFIWAICISYSRIYLGVHFPGDILAGIFLGILLGWLAAFFYRKIIRKFPAFQ